MNAIEIRKATQSDVPELVDLWGEIMQYHEGHTPYFVLVENFVELVTPMITERLESETVFVSLDDKEITGMIMFRIEDLPEVVPFAKRGYIAETVIKPSHRSQGIGKALVNQALAFFREEKCDVSELQVSAKNMAGIKFWESLGFEVGTWHMIKPLD